MSDKELLQAFWDGKSYYYGKFQVHNFYGSHKVSLMYNNTTCAFRHRLDRSKSFYFYAESLENPVVNTVLNELIKSVNGSCFINIDRPLFCSAVYRVNPQRRRGVRVKCFSETIFDIKKSEPSPFEFSRSLMEDALSEPTT